jgi:S1-C subfamily serine protease
MIRYGILLALICASVGAAQAQTLPTEMPAVGTAGKAGPDVNPMAGMDLQGRLLPSRAGALLKQKLSAGLATVRGAKEVQLYKKVAPSVVLVVTNEGLGSGSLIDGSGMILTNYHVVEGYREVGVIFKPKVEGQPVTPEQVIVANVVKIDEKTDLALLQLSEAGKLPKPIQLGNATDVDVGSDVNAIGHPTGEAWTFTKGIVSQIRAAYKWHAEDKLEHQADVIQTQTPINPGNSGGPLISETGALVGVNAFKGEGEGLNFAISVAEVKRFLAAPATTPKVAAQQQPADSCEPEKVVAEGRSKKNDGDILAYDFDCDGRAETRLMIPDAEEPIMVVTDRNGDERPDMIIVDENRDQRWDYSLYDDDFDGKYETEGLHPDGKLKASEYHPIQPS